MVERMMKMNKKIQCNTCIFAKYFEKQEGYYCVHPQQSKPRVIINCKKYQMGVRSPRWCRKKEIK